MGLKNKCAVGIDMIISTAVIKRIRNILTVPIAHICNLSFSTGVFPDAFKISQIKPIHKGQRPCQKL